jgi:RND family efflux transporter MFP subunit
VKVRLFAVAVLLASGAVMIFAKGLTAFRGLSVETGVVLTPVARSDVTRIVTVLGSVVPAGREAVHALISARVDVVHVRVGDIVQKGELLARLDDASWKSDIARRELAVARAERAIDQAADNADLRVRELELAEARTELTRAHQNRTAFHLRSPISGEVVAVGLRPGQVLSPGGPPAFVVAAPGVAEIDIEADEFEIGGIAEGQPAVVFVDAWSSRPLPATVAKTPVLRRARAVGAPAMYGFSVLLDEAPADLKWGFTARVEIEVARTSRVLVVPVAALVTFDGAVYVIIDDGRSGRRAVEVRPGLTDHHVIAIDGELEAGEQVVLADSVTLQQMLRELPSGSMR